MKEHWAVFAAAAVLAAAYLPMAAQLPSLRRSLIKTASVLLLALAAFLADGPALLVLALCACAAGDAFLSREGDTAFMAGAAAFAAGHVIYAALFLGQPDSSMLRLAAGPQLWLMAGLGCLGLGAAAVLAPRAGALKAAVLGYIPVILAMGLAALTLPPGLVLAAALAFILSDLILSAETFVLPPEHPQRRLASVAVWLLYWGAQAGFFLAFA